MNMLDEYKIGFWGEIQQFSFWFSFFKFLLWVYFAEMLFLLATYHSLCLNSMMKGNISLLEELINIA